MKEFFIENSADIIVLALVITALFLAIRKIIKNKKSGKSGCSCGCEGCAFKDNCNKK